MKIKRVRLLAGILVAWFFFLSPYVSYSDNSAIAQQFEQANLLYKENKYAQAIAAYETILQQGFESGNLCYNLGNSYFKQGALGKAILNYERAKLFIPQDSDVQSNSEYARSLLHISIQDAPGCLFKKWVDRLSSGITINHLTLVVALAQAAVFLLLILKMLRNTDTKFSNACIVILVVILASGGVALKRKIDYLHTGAIVVSKEIDSKFEPLESSTTYFTLSEGSKIDVIESSGAWCKIRRFDGKVGWVNLAGLEFILLR